MSKTKRVAPIVLAVAALAPCAAAAADHTAAGIALARSALLHRSDLGRQWTQSSPAPAKVPPLTCAQLSPPLPGVSEVGDAESPTWQQSPSGPFVSQSAYAYGTAAQQAAVWSRLARRKFLSCVADALAGASGYGVHFTVKHERLLSLPRVAASAAGYRASGTASTTGQTVNVYLDVILLGRGSTISALSLSSFEQPVAQRLELRLARLVARRLRG